MPKSLKLTLKKSNFFTPNVPKISKLIGILILMGTFGSDQDMTLTQTYG